MLKALAILLLLAVPALAAGTEKPPPRWTCWLVRTAVAKYGEENVVATARARGISEAEIERARKCLAKP
jgi:hypothetical protein